MTLHLVAELAAKSVLISGAGLALLFLLKHRSAAERSWLAHAAVLSLLALPLATLLLPRWRLLTPVPPPSSLPGGHASASDLDPAAWALALYAFAAGLLLLGTLISVVRLRVLQSRSDVVTDASWLTALARAQQRMKVRYGAALLVSGKVSSPLSWGLMRPTILLDPGILSRPDSAEAIITHELAHVRHLDWLKLLMARVVTAIFWFNPLVWILARHCHQLREEAADDAVINADVPGTDYASLLVEAARHENRALFFTAHGVAPGKNSLRQRVTRVLDQSSARNTVSAPWALGGLACMALIASPLAAATLERAFVASAVTPSAAQPAQSAEASSTPPSKAITITAPPQPREIRKSPAARTLRVTPRPASPAPTATTFAAVADGQPLPATVTPQTLTFAGNTITVASPAQTKPKPATQLFSGNVIRVESPAAETASGQDD